MSFLMFGLKFLVCCFILGLLIGFAWWFLYQLAKGMSR